MKFFCGLGMVCVLVGASLMLPRHASATDAIPNCPFLSITDLDVIVGEFVNGDPMKGPSETAVCDIPSVSVSTEFVLLEPGTHKVSDVVTLEGHTGFTTVTLTSDPGEPDVKTSLTSEGIPELAGGNIFPITEDVNLTVVSDVDVPEPSTGLLLGSALPALLAIRRFAPRRSAS